MAKRNGSGISFQPIPGPNGNGQICLNIKRPGEWFDSTEYIPFVGGCGVGGATTLSKAKMLLLFEAERSLERRIAEANSIAAHYKAELQKLHKHGIQPLVERK